MAALGHQGNRIRENHSSLDVIPLFFFFFNTPRNALERDLKPSYQSLLHSSSLDSSLFNHTCKYSPHLIVLFPFCRIWVLPPAAGYTSLHIQPRIRFPLLLLFLPQIEL